MNDRKKINTLEDKLRKELLHVLKNPEYKRFFTHPVYWHKLFSLLVDLVEEQKLKFDKIFWRLCENKEYLRKVTKSTNNFLKKYRLERWEDQWLENEREILKEDLKNIQILLNTEPDQEEEALDEEEEEQLKSFENFDYDKYEEKVKELLKKIKSGKKKVSSIRNVFKEVEEESKSNKSKKEDD